MNSDKHDINKESLPYLKIFPEEYLSSSLHYNCSLEAQGYFTALICLAAKNRKERGTFSLEKGQPMPESVIANALYIDIETNKRLWQIMVEQDRVSMREDGVWYITNFDYYQNKYRRSHNAKDISQVYAIQRSKEERTRKNVRENPEIATDELVKITEEKCEKQKEIDDINNEIENLKDKARGN